MLIIAGLGNPGPEYANHRHNIGFRAVDAIAAAHGFGGWRQKFNAQISDGRIGSEKVLLMKPMTFMNLSGQAIGEALRFHKLAPEDVVVIHDELDLAPAKVRIKTGGGNGGHNGLKSIDAHIGKDYRRLRLGIGHPGQKHLVSGYVLHDFAKAEEAWVGPLIDAIAAEAPLLAKGQDAQFANKVPARIAPDAPAEAVKTKPAKPAQANNQLKPKAPEKAPESEAGPLAAGLAKLFGLTKK